LTLKTQAENKILNKQEIQHKISRIAFEIYENNYLEKDIYVAGIPSGYKLAELLARQLEQISPFQISVLEIVIEKSKGRKDIVSVNCEPSELKGKVLILVDDVLHTGRTFLHSLRPFLDVEVKKIETVALINRSHTMFPIHVNYTGYELATTLNDHIEVDLESDEYGVYLF
jgi:pyrimidine operon attenuation protein/uracil phosphoribosyltransferase